MRRGTGGVGLPFAERPAGVCPPPGRPLLRAAAIARGNLGPALGTRGAGAVGGQLRLCRGEGGRTPGCGRWRRGAGLPGMPSGAAAWGGATQPCNSSCCPWLKIPPCRSSPSAPLRCPGVRAPALPTPTGAGPSPGTNLPLTNLSSRGVGPASAEEGRGDTVS